ncbi:hypothetical protein PVAP13_8KG202513, partial [Panicum virgatum]
EVKVGGQFLTSATSISPFQHDTNTLHTYWTKISTEMAMFAMLLHLPKVGDQMDHISDWANVSSFKETSERNWTLEFSGQSALTDTT